MWKDEARVNMLPEGLTSDGEIAVLPTLGLRGHREVVGFLER